MSVDRHASTFSGEAPFDYAERNRTSQINDACRYFRGSIPCAYNKLDGSECSSCKHVSEYRDRILLIKLDAIGDVLRSASLLPPIINRHASPYIAWLTRRESVELVQMMKYVDETIEFSPEGLARVMSGAWDRVYSLSNDLTSASLAAIVPSKRGTVGFVSQAGRIMPTNSAASHWLEMAAFDRVKRENSESYQHRMLAILGASDSEIAAPALRVDEALRTAARSLLAGLFKAPRARRVAVNIGSGGRWPKKMLAASQIYEYCRLLCERTAVDVVLVGGAAESTKADAIMRMCRSSDQIRPALTGKSIAEFVALLSEVDLLLSGDTLALHVATAIGLPTIALFGPTSAAEIYPFGNLITKIWTKDLDCLCCYGDCNKEAHCMFLIDVPELVALTVDRLGAIPRFGVGRDTGITDLSHLDASAAGVEASSQPRDEILGEPDRVDNSDRPISGAARVLTDASPSG